MISDLEELNFENSSQELSELLRGSHSSHSPFKDKEKKEPQKKRSKTKNPKKNKIPKLKILNKLVVVKTGESLNDVQEFEFLRDELLDFDDHLKKPAVQFKINKEKTCKSTKFLAQSVLMNSSPRDMLVVQQPKDVQGVIAKVTKSGKREGFLENLKNLASRKKHEKISVFNDFCNDSGKDLESSEKKIDKNEGSGKFIKKPCEVDPESVKDQEVFKTEKNEPSPKTGQKRFIDPQSLLTRYDLKVFDCDINLKRLSSDNEKAEKKQKGSGNKGKATEVAFDDIEDVNYDEEKHLGKIIRFRKIKDTRKDEDFQADQKIDDGILSLLQKPEAKIIPKTLIGSEALTNFKTTEGSANKSRFFFKVHQISSSNKENSLRKSVKKLEKKNLLFLLK
jgi:hypothetical protein